MEKLVCDYCGISYNCAAATGKDRFCFMHLPNMRGGFDLADVCVCPDCLTRGNAGFLVKDRYKSSDNVPHQLCKANKHPIIILSVFCTHQEWKSV